MLIGRIRALARAHGLLAAGNWDGVDLARLLAEELTPLAPGGARQVAIGGPPLLLSPGASQAMAMVVHELAINAARFGALSADGGHLAVTWQLASTGEKAKEGRAADPARLELMWAETGGPAVSVPERVGFGFTTIRGAIEHQLAGSIGFDWPPDGMTCRITIPAAGNMLHEGPACSSPSPPRPSRRGPHRRSCRNARADRG